MNVLITGGAGFIGSHVTEYILSQGHTVTVLDNRSTESTFNLRASVPFLKQDLREPLERAFAQVRPEVVVHLAAQVSVPKSFQDPFLDLQTNVAGVINLLDAAAATGTRKVVAISTAAVYGAASEMPITEASAVRPLSPYGLSKATGEEYIHLLCGLRKIAYTIIRPSNIYGPRQVTEGEGAVVPAFLGRFLAGQDPVLHGDGTQTRDFLYVGDIARAIGQALTRADGLTLNVSSGTGTAILELWGLLAELLGWKRPPRFVSLREGDIPHSVMSNDLARQHLDWEPQISLRAGLARTLAAALSAQAAPGQVSP